MMELAEGVRFELTKALASLAGFQDRCLKPLGHPSGYAFSNAALYRQILNETGAPGFAGLRHAAANV
jgi:hypothetical protein